MTLSALANPSDKGQQSSILILPLRFWVLWVKAGIEQTQQLVTRPLVAVDLRILRFSREVVCVFLVCVFGSYAFRFLPCRLHWRTRRRWGRGLHTEGEYKPNGVAVTGVYDFQIVLFNVETGGAAVAAVTLDNVAVTQGQFTVEVNYGAAPFAAAAQYWLETRVRPGASTGAFTILPVRQKLNAVPYALNVRALPPGIVTGSALAPNAVGPVAILDNSITAADIGPNAVGLTEINSTQLQARATHP